MGEVLLFIFILFLIIAAFAGIVAFIGAQAFKFMLKTAIELENELDEDD